MPGSPLISLPPAPGSPDGAVTGADGWWPGIDRNAARAALRLGEIVTDERLVMALQGAVITVTGDLAAWQFELAGIGANSLAAITAEQLLAMRLPAEPVRFAAPYSFVSAGGDSCPQIPTYPYPPWYTRARYTDARAAFLARQIDGASLAATIYTRAVRNFAAAELVELAADIGTTHRGDIRAEARMDPAAEYQRLGAEGVRDLLGQTRTTVELV